ncbi:CPBP family intramembrane metalloprotease [Bifidobacterium sp. LC6]|uniref:CPBP family intramembrane metalloprotease n=1 Tax=Bifidobacterium colobi TaxID=2809026 RepID=A0ABS5USS3_9BIFI|nr:CPBP family intramembrane metalloprotease [Bifidobacterium colobi]
MTPLPQPPQSNNVPLPPQPPLQYPQQPPQSQPLQPQLTNWLTIARRRFSLIGAALVLMMVLWIGLNTIIGFTVVHFVGHHVPSWVQVLISSGPLYIIAMPVSLALFLRVPVTPTRRYSMRANEFIQLLIMCLPVMYGGNIIGQMLSAGLTQGTATNRLNSLVANSDWWFNALFIAVLAPIFEEWIFRKEIISRLRRYGEKTAIVFSALAFALFHMNVFQFFYAFGLGLLFGYIYIRTSNMWYTVAMHMAVNLNGAVVAPLLLSSVDSRWLSGTMSESEVLAMMQSGQSVGMAIVALYATALVGLLIAGIVLLVRWFQQRRWEFYPAPEELPKPMRMRTAYINPGVMVYGLLTIGLTVWALFV